MSFTPRLLIRICIVVLLTVLFTVLVISRSLLFAPVTVALLIVIAIAEMISFVTRSQRDLAHFAESMREGVFSESFTRIAMDPRYEQFRKALQNVSRGIAQVAMEKELHYQYLKALNENINVGILTFDEHGKVITINSAAGKLLGTTALRSLEHLRKIEPRLCQLVSGLKAEQRRIIESNVNGEILQLSVHTKELIIGDDTDNRRLRIVILQNLNRELETREAEAWHELLRVLTHEIMNSVTPITTLSKAMQNTIARITSDTTLSQKNISELIESIEAIVSRSQGLLTFVHRYKALSDPLNCTLIPTKVFPIARRIIDLLSPEFVSRGIDVNIDCPDTDITAPTDVAAIEHVFINLLRNSMDAFAEGTDGRIDIAINQAEYGGVIVSVRDNGSGIAPENLSRIFIPFFTTKINGSGIGLSLAREIMNAHNGTISVRSLPGQGTIFTLEWGP